MKTDLTPIEFKEANCKFVAPGCGDLPLLRIDNYHISCWHLTWCQRIKLLICGRLWLSVINCQPPVSLAVDKPFMTNPGPDRAATPKEKHNA